MKRTSPEVKPKGTGGDGLTAVTVIGVLGRFSTRSDLELRLWDDLVHCVCTPTKDLAGIAVAGFKCQYSLVR